MDVERAKEILSDILEITEDDGVASLTKYALRALDDEASPEVWEAVHSGFGEYWTVRRRGDGRIVAGHLDKTDARRIADEHNRMAKLEKAARDVVETADARGFDYGSMHAANSIDRLAAVLKQED